MSKNGQYIYAKSGKQLILYKTAEKFDDNIAYKFNGPVQAGPILANWEASVIGEWNEIQYMGKQYFIYELFDLKYSYAPWGSGNIPFIEAAPTAYAWTDLDNEEEPDNAGLPDWVPDGLSGAIEEAKVTVGSFKTLALIFGVLYLLGRLQAVAPALPRMRKRSVRRAIPRAAAPRKTPQRSRKKATKYRASAPAKSKARVRNYKRAVASNRAKSAPRRKL